MVLPIGNKIPEEPVINQNGQIMASHYKPEHDCQGRTYP